ncbi:beta-L-arabinofuranosidase domain-containing protein [Paenibacillus thermotolerans]|uniref:beta-L-arabinofuranosidase domain-containing protein n=1 Tax=Paenibacillus thermotolerans TaxID=3027807 RepID=UPI0023674885|nr:MULTISPECIES: beta-L-arabinofuranosidase domain-containing protein [unclassified Paenibacillus]
MIQTKLRSPLFRHMTVNEIKPRGWLLEQLKTQAAGLSGNLDRFWPDIKDSRWIGGAAEGWERVPYWLDGFIPLAWLLDDPDLKKRAQRYIDYMIEHQGEDGWICPDTGPRHQYDMWAHILVLKVLVVYYEATGDDRIEEVVRKGFIALDRHIDGTSLFNWGQFRWFEALIPIWWLYERTGGEWLLHLASKLQAQGFDWISFFKHWPYRKPDGKGRWSFMSHVVNNAMMLKSGALLWRMTGEQEHLDSAKAMVELLDRYHGMVTGVFTGDECLAGTSPVQGTELCAVAEYMYSLEHLMEYTDQASWGDRLEKIAYNALPATFSPDMWSHQYDQQINQVQCSRQQEPIFNTNSGESHLFGLEPNFGCCTANLSQPWPKLALSTFLRSEDGLAAAVYAPCEATTEINGARVRAALDTLYPFRETLQFTVETDREVEFTLSLRIPEWTTEEAVLIVGGRQVPVTPGGYHRITNLWSGTTSFTLRLPMKTAVIPRPNALAAVTRGPLVYSLPIGERWEQTNCDVPGREHPHCDYEIYPTTPWNYGLAIRKDEPEKDIMFEERPVGDRGVFSPEGAPIVARVKGRKVDWELVNGCAAPAPRMQWVSEEEEQLTLIPYGCTNLRLTEMPLV